MKILQFTKEEQIPNQKIITKIEALLEKAKTGELKGFVGVELSNNEVNHIQSGEIRENYLLFIGMLFDLQIDLKHDYEEGFL